MTYGDLAAVIDPAGRGHRFGGRDGFGAPCHNGNREQRRR